MLESALGNTLQAASDTEMTAHVLPLGGFVAELESARDGAVQQN